DHFVEIGQGRGAITEAISSSVERLDVVEIDRDLADALEQQVWAKNIRVNRGDALKFDFSTLPHDGEMLRLVGNLPYNISTPLLFHFLESAELFQDIYVMLQKEVVQRMAAEPGTKQYGRLTAMLAARCEVDHLFNIGPNCFTPPPKVDSSFARLTPLKKPLVSDELYPAYKQVVTQAFGMRRKTLGNSLKGLLDVEAISAAGINSGLRAEVLSPRDFLKLAEKI
ncbi:MAG: 16S rRNA (adenine(1518)-N(6)/adenine(1519)-N(6))-dimethyltransferase RsmA, partial [Gammaproteobacteria bacterium]|nr:16S rRNA (adenine(1518)-N(6)/adenine(1519)-N(6))-dimethyltransferase RsmA [Gammaproteobacteria bacterium]